MSRTSLRKIKATHHVIPFFIGYLRVSKERDETGSFTFETQEQRIRESLDRKYGKGQYKIVFLRDDGLSGGLAMSPTGMQRKIRPTLVVIAEMIRSGEYDGVVVYGQNRFFRNARGIMEMVQDVLLPAGKILLSATEELDIETSDGRMMIYMKALFDEKLREDIVERNRDAAATRAEQGYPIGQVGYGWQRDPSHTVDTPGRRGIVPVEAEQHWVMHIKEKYMSGWNAVRIAGDLNQLSVPSPLMRDLWSEKAKKLRTRDGRVPRWTDGTVWNVLRNPLHAGLIKLKSGERITGRHFESRFWNPEVLEQIESEHERRMNQFKTTTAKTNNVHLLSAIIHCARCGRRLYMDSTSESTKRFRSYKCDNGAHEGERTCPDVTVRAQWVEDAVVEVINSLTQEPEMFKLMEAEVQKAIRQGNDGLREEKAQLKRKIQESEEKQTRWASAFSSGVIDEARFAKYVATLEEEETQVAERLHQVEKQLDGRASQELWLRQVRKQLESFPSVWEELDQDEKRQVLSLVIEEGGLTADRDGRDIKLRIKLHLLPLQEKTIIYTTCRGTRKTKATGLLRLSLRQMVLLHYAGLGKSRKECAELMGVKASSVVTIEKTIRKNLGGVTWGDAVEMARERVEANLFQLPLGHGGKAEKVSGTPQPSFLTPVLMEVFVLFAQGATTKEVADRLHLDPSTVQGRRARILKHFGTKSMFEAVEKARAGGVVL